MTAPSRPPIFFDLLAGRAVEMPHALREPGFLIDDMARDVESWPDWVLDDDSRQAIRLRVIEHVNEQLLVVGFEAGTAHGTITATPDPSGYLRAVVHVAGAEYLTLYGERIWEEFELWPPGASAGAQDEAPGRMGKRRNWVSISAAGWPVLAAVANDHGWLNLRQQEAPLR